MGKSLISNHIRKLRFNQDEMTQQQLADKVGVTRQTIVALEQGKYSLHWNWHFELHVFSNYRWKMFSLSRMSRCEID